MSKNGPTKSNMRSPQNAPLLFPVAHKSGLHVATIREVTSVPAPVSREDEKGLIVPCRDLNENDHLRHRRYKQQLLFAFSLFLLLGLLIFAGQVILKPRMVASSAEAAVQDKSAPEVSERVSF